jgi:hypothetical protein
MVYKRPLDLLARLDGCEPQLDHLALLNGIKDEVVDLAVGRLPVVVAVGG